MSPEKNIAVVLASIDAFNAGDVDAQMATYAPDAVVASDPGGGAAMVFPARSRPTLSRGILARARSAPRTT